MLLFHGSENEKPRYTLNREFNDEVWFVIDTDNWNKGDKINTLRLNCNKQDNWLVAQSNPCFEIWLYYHCINTKPMESDINQYTSFKEYVGNKIKGGFDYRKHPILIQNAIINVENNFEINENQPMYLSTEVFLLAKSILPFIKDVIDKYLQNI